ncbi:MAG: hypothetical protein AAFN81_22120, partial [Bacteroidota bacterium]
MYQTQEAGNGAYRLAEVMRGGVGKGFQIFIGTLELMDGLSQVCGLLDDLLFQLPLIGTTSYL